MQVCKHCRLPGDGNYCANCGEIYQPPEITVHSILHEVVHTFTHADKGLLYTLKNLASHPGTMQRNYLEGERNTNQKPFSLFFICASVTAIALHFVSAPSPGSQSHFEIEKGMFYKNYFVIVQALLIPFYSLLNWAVFYRRNFNYAKALVLFMYSLAFSFLVIIPINFLRYISTSINEQLVELVVLGAYMIWTNLNFFSEEKKWRVILKSILLFIACYFTSTFVANFVIRQML